MHACLHKLRAPAAAALALVALWPPLWHLYAVVANVHARAAYPQDIEWMEGAHVYHAYRLAHGLYLYGDPARGFATFPYPPLYWVAIAASGAVGYTAARLASIACVAGAAAILAGAAARGAPRPAAALYAFLTLAGIAAGYPICGGSYDLARPDAIAIFFPVLAAALAGDGRLGVGRALAVALALIAAMYSKQTGVLYVPWIVAFVAARDRRSALVVGGATALGSLVLLALLCAATGGWFWVWMVDQAHHRLNPAAWAVGVGAFLIHAPFLLLVPGLLAELRRRRALAPVTAKWVGVLASAVVAAMVPFTKVGGWLNVLMPVVVLSWPVTLMLWRDLGGSAKRTLLLPLVAAGAVLLVLKYDRTPFVPAQSFWEDSARLRELLRTLDGPVVVTTSPFVAVREGKGREEPILQGFGDATNAGMHVDYVDALDKSGARWVITTGHEPDIGAFEAKFARVRELDFRVCSIIEWDRPARAVLWRRRD